MAVQIEIETNPLDEIRDGQVYVLKKGQTRIVDEIDIQDGGELVVPDLASLILE